MRTALYGKSDFIGALDAVKDNFTVTQEQQDDLKNGIAVSQDVMLDGNIQQVRLTVFDWGRETLGSVTIPVSKIAGGESQNK